ncbi:MAG: hypothetical protein ACOZF0_07545 [Thermodesulfobacteriota bacterium]
MKYLTAVMLLLLSTGSAFAKDGLFHVTYSLAQPSGAMTDVVEDKSYRGIEFGYRKFAKRNISFGIMSGWNSFEDRYSNVFEIQNGHIYGTKRTYLNAFPIMVNGHYYIGGHGPRFYMGLNAGTINIRKDVYLGIYTVDEGNWHWAMAPEIGFIYPFKGHGMPWRITSLFLNAKYNYAFRVGDTIDYTYWGLNLGFSFDVY